MLKPASEMRKKTEVDVNKLMEPIEAEISKDIERASQKGHTCLYSPKYYELSEPYKSEMKKRLERLGYKVEETWDQRENSGWATISW